MVTLVVALVALANSFVASANSFVVHLLILTVNALMEISAIFITGALEWSDKEGLLRILVLFFDACKPCS